MQAMAERVMRAVRADPALLSRALNGDEAAQETTQAAAQGEQVPGFPDRVRNDEERELVERLLREGKSIEDIRTALDKLRKRQGRPGTIDLPIDPDDLLKQGWIELTHPEAAKVQHRTFKNPITGEVLSFDRGRPDRAGFARRDHYHRDNPARTGNRDYYLDRKGNPVAKGSKQSHLIPGAI